jgi:UDP-N-acetylglucosamine diphosphorylase/glucosamine-1-phosphate N-acetyltransferase
VNALVLYEDRHWRNLRPLTDTLPVPALAFGASDLARRWLVRTGRPLIGIEARAGVMAAWAQAPAFTKARPTATDEVLALNAAVLPGPWLEAALAGRSPCLLLAERRVAGARLPFGMLAAGLGRGADFEIFLLGLALPAQPVEAPFLDWPWDFVARNAAAITEDLSAMTSSVEGEVHERAVLLEPGRISIAKGATIGPLAVLDARGGPIRVAEGATIAPQTVVSGPCVIGERTQLLGGFVSGTTFGPECRIAGEVEASIWQGYANKRHHGFVGHSVIGEWVNLGALTTTSDLKNNYGPVRVWIDGREIDSGDPKVGAILGAHVKTGIGTLLPTGVVIGVGANLFGGGRFAPKAVPAFGWWDGERMDEHRLDAFLATARIALSRRGRTMGSAEDSLLIGLFEATAGERRSHS